MLCATLGRPTMVAGSEVDPVPLPTELDEEYFQSGHFERIVARGDTALSPHTSSGPSILSFFVCSATLFEIVQQILLTFYAEDNSSSARDPEDYFTGHTSIFDIDARLTKWLASVPAHLYLDSYNVNMAEEPGLTSTFRRQAVVLRIR